MQIINLWIRIIERNIFIKKLAFQLKTIYGWTKKLGKVRKGMVSGVRNFHD